MKIKLHTKPFHYITINNLWSKQERQEMFNEIKLFESKSLFLNPEETQSAVNVKKEMLKKNKAQFWDDIWKDRNYSNVLTHNRKLFDVFNNKIVQKSWYFKGVNFNHDNTLVSYYENSDYYKSHIDYSMVTALSYFFDEPKRFTGGKIKFTDYNLEFAVTNKLTIIFPSNIKHEVSEIKLEKQYVGKGLGRFCMNQFINSETSYDQFINSGKAYD